MHKRLQTARDMQSFREREDTSKGKDGDEKKAKDQDSTNIEVNPEIYKALAEAEAARDNNGKTASDDQVKDSEKNLKAVLDAAKKIGQKAQNPKMDNKEMETLIRDEINTFLETVNSGMKQDMKRVREEVFGANVFWVTEMNPTAERPSEIVPGSWLVRGNLRTTKDEAFDKVVQGVDKLFGNKYTVFIIPDPEADLQEPPRGNAKAKERVAFVVTPSQYVNQPQEGPGWQLVAAGLLFLLAFGAATRIGVIANTPKFLPQSIIELLAQPDSYNADTVPPELANFDFKPLLLSSVPISSAILVIQGLQEAAHRAVANARNVKLATPLFIPNDQIGLFGAVTQIKSLLRSRKDLFDIAAAGPLAGGLGALALFGTGLLLSIGGAREDLLPVPAALLQGSLLLGGATQAVLGTGTAAANTAAGSAAAAATIAVHPFVIGGWCGLVAVALNCLPVGSLDGGRMVQAAFGRQSLSISSFFVYVALGLGLLGSSLALPFGLYVLLFQRIPEKGIQDTVTSPGGNSSFGELFVQLDVTHRACSQAAGS
ncbi:hypothetical protein WJX73_001749 [Symbiochloris irregularis]|uniref:Peptidase M50 domain-containing protein n=1 Tax=Symbiochloris irregularis TaxID=706552 RepID=A0AAW1PY68_9CHLO